MRSLIISIAVYLTVLIALLRYLKNPKVAKKKISGRGGDFES